MTSCEMLGHDVETIYTKDGGVYRHGADRFAWTHITTVTDGEREALGLREKAFAEWLRLVHTRDAALGV